MLKLKSNKKYTLCHFLIFLKEIRVSKHNDESENRNDEGLTSENEAYYFHSITCWLNTFFVLAIGCVLVAIILGQGL